MTSSRAPAKIIPRAFPGIKPHEIEEMIANSQVHAYAPGEVLCRENAIEDRFYMILEGEVEVTKVINNSEVRVLKRLEPGAFFGELSLLDGQGRSATISADTDAELSVLSQTVFLELVNKDPRPSPTKRSSARPSSSMWSSSSAPASRSTWKKAAICGGTI